MKIASWIYTRLLKQPARLQDWLQGAQLEIRSEQDFLDMLNTAAEFMKEDNKKIWRTVLKKSEAVAAVHGIGTKVEGAR